MTRYLLKRILWISIIWLSHFLLFSQEYLIQEGDSLYSIAQDHQCTVEDIMRVNNLSSSNIYPGTTLILPNRNNYQVQRGDSLSEIALKFNVSIGDLKEINHLSSDTIRIGQILEIPQVGLSLPGRNYQVKDGDTLWGIAQGFSTTAEEIQRYNQLDSPVIYPGMNLQLPSQANPGQRRAMVFYDTMEESSEKGPWFGDEPNRHRQPSLVYYESPPQGPRDTYLQAKSIYEKFKMEVQLQGLITRNLRGWRIVLDPGHGGLDPGAIVESRDGNGNSSFVVEDEYAYDITLRLAALLMQHGAQVELTLLSPNHHIRRSPDASASFVNQKNEVFNSQSWNHSNQSSQWPRGSLSSLRQRKAIAAEWIGRNSQKTLFLSIHCDNTPSSSHDSASLFYGSTPGELENNRILAQHMADYLGGYCLSKEQNLEVLENNPAQYAALLEVRNIARADNSWILRNEELRNQEVSRIFSGIESFILSR